MAGRCQTERRHRRRVGERLRDGSVIAAVGSCTMGRQASSGHDTAGQPPGTLRARRLHRARGCRARQGLCHGRRSVRPLVQRNPHLRRRFGPGWTDYRVRVPFHGHDITASLSPGTSVLGAMLGEGWFSGYVGPFGKRAVWGEYPLLRAVVIIEYADGSVQHEVTGSDWECTTGPIRMAELLHGYRQDNRISLGDWSAAFGGWDPVQVEAGPAGDLVPARIPVARIVREVPAVAVLRSPCGVADPGLRAEPGGSRATETARGARHHRPASSRGDPRRGRRALSRQPPRRGGDGRDRARGGGEELLDPIFTYHGFRFVEVDGALQELSIEDATAVAVSSLDGISLELRTDDEMLDRIQRNLEWGMLSNFIEVPTDCPNRDERLGWAGDVADVRPRVDVQRRRRGLSHEVARRHRRCAEAQRCFRRHRAPAPWSISPKRARRATAMPACSCRGICTGITAILECCSVTTRG